MEKFWPKFGGGRFHEAQFFFTIVDLANLFLAKSPMIPPSLSIFFPPCKKSNATHFSRFSSSRCFRHRPLANTHDTSQVAKMVSQDGIEIQHSHLLQPLLCDIAPLNPLPGWRTPPSNIVTSCVSRPPPPVLLLTPFSRRLQSQKEPGSACQTSTQGPLSFQSISFTGCSHARFTGLSLHFSLFSC